MPGLGKRSFQMNVSFWRSFPFSGNERFVLYVHFRSVEMNISFTTFSSVQWKWTFRSLRSFPFIKNERKWTFRSFQLGWAQKSPKMTQKKAFLGSKVAQKWPKTQKWTEMNAKNDRNVHFRSVQLNGAFTAFISVQYNWTFRSLRSFPFSTNERFVHCVHFRSVQMNGIERSVHLGLISRQKLEKWTELNGTFKKWTELNGTNWTEMNAMPNPAKNTPRPLATSSNSFEKTP